MTMKRLLFFLAALLLTVPLLAQSGPNFERILLPIFTNPVHGAFGSEFHTELRAYNDSQFTLTVHGFDRQCPVLCIPLPDLPFELPPQREVEPQDFLMSGNPGRFIYVPKDRMADLSMNLRVFDVTRSALNFGTEMPIVRAADFRINRLTLLGIPTDPKFRNTLRIYSPDFTNVLISINDQPPVRVSLTAGADMFSPSYGVFTDFPTGQGPVRVTIDIESLIITLVPIETPVWAFVTVTNNETQAISTITPQP
jgi:hypothetical protein